MGTRGVEREEKVRRDFGQLHLYGTTRTAAATAVARARDEDSRRWGRSRTDGRGAGEGRRAWSTVGVADVRIGDRRRRRCGVCGQRGASVLEVPVKLGHKHWVGRRANLTQVYFKDLLSERCDKRVATIRFFALPAPSEGWEHVKRHPDIFECDLASERVATRHVSEKDDHRGDVQWNG